MAAAIDCLAGVLFISKKEQSDIPNPSDLNTINLATIANELDCTLEGSFVNLVSVDVNLYAKETFEKPVKKTLTIPSWLNKIATEQKINFSQVLQEALLTKIKL